MNVDGSTMKITRIKRRELLNLILVLVISIAFSLFSISINFIDKFYRYFEAYTSLPIAEFLINAIFLWLTGLLWITYRHWRKAVKRQRELEDIISSIRPDVLMVVDRDRNIIMCNASVKRVFGYEVEEVIDQKTDLFYFDRRSKPSHKHEIHDALKRVGFHVGEAAGKKKSGAIIPLEIITAKLSGREGVVLLLRDISESKLAEESLRESEERFRLAFENAKDAILWADPETGLIINCNKAAEKLLEKKREEVISHQQTSLHPPQKADYYSMMFKRHIEQKGVVDDEAEIITKSGKIIPVHITASLNLIRGKPIIQGIFHDITERKKAEEALKYSEEKYHNLIEFANVGIITTEKGKITQINKKAEEIYSYSRNELIGKSPNTLTLEKYRKQHREMLDELLKSGKAKKMYFEEEGVRKDGSIFPIEISYSLSKSKGGKEYSIIAIMRDISERKKAERELRETKEFLENIIETTVDGILITDVSGNITSLNSSLERLSGLGREELIGEHASILIAEDQEIRKMFRDKAAELFEKGSTSYESALKRKDSKYVEVDINSSLIKDEKGDYIAGVSIFRDITERKKAAMEIRKAKEFLENLFKTSTDAILVTDPQGNITVVNDTMEKMVGYSKDELLGKHSSILNPPDKELRSRIVRDLKKLFEEGSIYGHETTWQRKDGHHIFVESNKSLLKDKDGHVIGGVNFARDVTEKKKVKSMLLQAEKLKSLGELAGGVAHDFNNVLAAILGRVQLLRMHLEPPAGKQEKRKSMLELKAGLGVIERAAMDGAETVKRIQEFSRRRADDKNFTQVDINELIVKALEFTRARWKDSAESKGVKIVVKKEFSPLPSTAGSEAELREVFNNLINNALDAMPQGGHLKIETFKEDNCIGVKVKDTGDGIPEAVRDRIFDPFFTTKGVQSTGLGLSVSYGIINRHRGTISVDSVEGGGTTFTIKIPIVEKTIKEEKIKFTPQELGKARILVIEDEEEVRNLLKDILTDAGHEVEIAGDGLQGVEIFEKKEFDLVFTDLGMPVMSGWQVAEKIKSVNGKVPVALITGWNVELKESEMKDNCLDLIIQKPFAVNQVLRLVQKGMELRDRFKAGVE